MPTIPASDIVVVNPAVISAGGRALDLVGIMLTNSTRVPLGTVQQFPDALGVSDYFGPSSDEYAKAQVYFGGFDNSNVKPSLFKVAQYNTARASAFLRGASVASMTLAALQALSGTIIVTVDGFLYTSGTINLSAATSFSNAASLIATALAAVGPGSAAFTASLAPGAAPDTANMTVSVVASGAIKAGQLVAGSGVTANTYVMSQTSGSAGGTGVYVVSNSQTVASESMTTSTPGGGPAVTYDSISGGFLITSSASGLGSSIGYASGTISDDLLLRQADGAVVSQGAKAAVPGSFMDGLVAADQDWATFFTLFDPDGSGNTNKLLFSQWVNGKNNRYAYAAWDADAAPTTTVPATSSLGYLLVQEGLSGTFPIWAPDATKAAMACGTGASIDFTEHEGRITFKFRSQTGLVPDVTDETTANNLRANGYNFYGAWATANQQFQGLADGTVSGPFQWMDSYVNQMWLNNALQLALMELLFTVKSVPYNQAGYALIDAACLDPLEAAVNFGAIRAGVTLSALQAAGVNNAAGVQVDNTLFQRGWYLQVNDASPQVRQARASPPCTLWYMDGESIQKISLASVLVQ